jgi:ethanolaminephosphotransferase
MLSFNGALIFYSTLFVRFIVEARRTGSSSPLGLLFDHGIDAANTTIATMVRRAMLVSIFSCEV